MKKLYLLAVIVIIFLGGFIFFHSNNKFPHTPLPLEERVDSLMALRNLEEKIGQLVLFTSDIDVTGPTIREGYNGDIKSGAVGALFNAYGAEYTRELQKIAVEETRLGIPLLFDYDVIHGHKTIFPISLGEAASWDLEAIEIAAWVAAVEASAEGLHWTFAPMVDITRDPGWGRVSEGAGEVPYLGSAIARARVKRYQGEDLNATHTIMATVKHFAAYGASLAGRDYNTVDISERELRQTYLPPYKGALNAGAATVMTSFNELDRIPVTGIKYLMTDILRQEWGFDGFVVTDYNSINEMIPHGYARDLKQAAELAIKAAVDTDMQGAAYYDHLEELVQEGTVDMKTIDQSVKNILRLKFRLGHLDDPYRYSDVQREKEMVLSESHLEIARDVARKSIVLLKNENPTFPIPSEVKRLALIGPLADSQRDLIGSWSAAGDPDQAISLLSGLKKNAGTGIEFLHEKGSEIEGADLGMFGEAIKAAKSADFVILALGEAYWMSGEAASRSMIDLPGVQRELAEAIISLNKPTAVVMMNGRPFDEKEKYTSKYLDVANTPLYPFGYGSSYSSFTYQDLALDKKNYQMDETIHIQVRVKNESQRAGEEVVQLYIRDLVGSVTRPVKELKGFQKIHFKPG